MAQEQKKMRAPRFTIELPGDDNMKKHIMDKVKRVKEEMMRSLQAAVNYTELFSHVLEFWLEQRSGRAKTPSVTATQLLDLKKSSTCMMDMCVAAKPSLRKLLSIGEDHGRYCASQLVIKKVHYKGHVVLYKLQCRRLGGGSHTYWWSSSPQ